MAHLDVDMTGVKPAGEYQELPIGKYLVRVDETEKKGTKDRFDESGAPSPDNGKNFYLQIALSVHGGPNDGHIEFDRLNLWNSNSIAVNMAKAQLKSIFLATGVETSDSTALHGRWMVMEVKAQRNGQLGKYYEAAPASMIPKEAVGYTAEQLEAMKKPSHATAGVAQQASAPAPAAAADSALPSWAQKK